MFLCIFFSVSAKFVTGHQAVGSTHKLKKTEFNNYYHKNPTELFALPDYDRVVLKKDCWRTSN